jgi:hypothetical protein
VIAAQKLLSQDPSGHNAQSEPYSGTAYGAASEVSVHALRGKMAARRCNSCWVPVASNCAEIRATRPCDCANRIEMSCVTCYITVLHDRLPSMLRNDAIGSA